MNSSSKVRKRRSEAILPRAGWKQKVGEWEMCEQMPNESGGKPTIDIDYC